MFSFFENSPLPEDLMAWDFIGRKIDGPRFLRSRTILTCHNVLHSLPLIVCLDIGRTCSSRKSKRGQMGVQDQIWRLRSWPIIPGMRKNPYSSPPLDELDVSAGRAEEKSQSVLGDPHTGAPRCWLVVAIRLSSVMARLPLRIAVTRLVRTSSCRATSVALMPSSFGFLARCSTG